MSTCLCVYQGEFEYAVSAPTPLEENEVYDTPPNEPSVAAPMPSGFRFGAIPEEEAFGFLKPAKLTEQVTLCMYMVCML